MPEREFTAFWLRGGRVLAGMHVNDWDVQTTSRTWSGPGTLWRTVDLARLADSGVAFGGLVSLRRGRPPAPIAAVRV